MKKLLLGTFLALGTISSISSMHHHHRHDTKGICTSCPYHEFIKIEKNLISDERKTLINKQAYADAVAAMDRYLNDPYALVEGKMPKPTMVFERFIRLLMLDLGRQKPESVRYKTLLQEVVHYFDCYKVNILTTQVENIVIEHNIDNLRAYCIGKTHNLHIMVAQGLSQIISHNEIMPYLTAMEKENADFILASLT